MSKEQKHYTAKELIEIWALRSSGGSIKTAGPDKETRGDPVKDLDWQIKCYVESTPHFKAAEDVLRWLSIDGTWQTFPVCRLNESELAAVTRRGWMPYIDRAKSVRDLPRVVAKLFYNALMERVADDPFIPESEKQVETDEREGSGTAKDEIKSPTW